MRKKEKTKLKKKLEGSRIPESHSRETVRCHHRKGIHHTVSESSRPQIMTLSLLYRVAVNPVNYLVIAVSVSECPDVRTNVPGEI